MNIYIYICVYVNTHIYSCMRLPPYTRTWPARHDGPILKNQAAPGTAWHGARNGLARNETCLGRPLALFWPSAMQDHIWPRIFQFRWKFLHTGPYRAPYTAPYMTSYISIQLAAPAYRAVYGPINGSCIWPRISELSWKFLKAGPFAAPYMAQHVISYISI